MRSYLKSSAIRPALGLLLLVQVAGPALAQTQAPAQGRPSANRAAEEAACGGDATKFCGPAIPDEQKIAACLRANRDKISEACRAMLK